jgi:hypothetical protein
MVFVWNVHCAFPDASVVSFEGATINPYGSFATENKTIAPARGADDEVFITCTVILEVSVPFATTQGALVEGLTVKGPGGVILIIGRVWGYAADAIPTISSNPIRTRNPLFFRITITLEKIIVLADI